MFCVRYIYFFVFQMFFPEAPDVSPDAQLQRYNKETKGVWGDGKKSGASHAAPTHTLLQERV